MAKKLLMGNEAMAYAALEAGVRVVAGYPGTPSSEIVETVARLHAEGAAEGVHVEWSTNEKAALELLFGASLAGARGLFTCKQMGLNVASDALMSLNYVSTRGGLVLVVADDPGPISSQTEQDTRRFAMFAKVPVLDPATPEQAYDMIKAAFELSERFHTPVIVRPTTRVDHASAFFEVPDKMQAAPVPEGGFERDPSKWVIFPRRSYQAHAEINERLGQIAEAFSEEEPFASLNRFERASSLADEKACQGNGEGATDGDASEATATDVDAPAAFGILAGGISAAYAREALRIVEAHAKAAGIRMPSFRFMQVATPYPFPNRAIERFADGLADVLVLEELDSVLEESMLMWVGRTHSALSVRGKLTGEARDRGENDVDDIALHIERFLGLSGRLRMHRRVGGDGREPIAPFVAEELPVRPPVLCPGCPHRGSFYAVKQALSDVPAVLCGDIGCYTLGNAKPLDAVDTCLCMGAGITMAQGIATVDPGKKAVAFVGDSTFFASGMTGLANAAYNGHDITVMVLDNATTAMTGSQPHPGTGQTLMGPKNKPISIESVLVSCGFGPVFHANPLDKDASIVAAKAAIAHEGPSAVIFESPCIQLVKPKAPVVVNTEGCTGCKKCIKEIGCPAMSFDTDATGRLSKDRGQAVVDAVLCNGCGLCTQVCPFKAIDSLAFPEKPAEPARAERQHVAFPSEEMPLAEKTSSAEEAASVDETDAGAGSSPLEKITSLKDKLFIGKVPLFKDGFPIGKTSESGDSRPLEAIAAGLGAAAQVVTKTFDAVAARFDDPEEPKEKLPLDNEPFTEIPDSIANWPGGGVPSELWPDVAPVSAADKYANVTCDAEAPDLTIYMEPVSLADELGELLAEEAEGEVVAPSAPTEKIVEAAAPDVEAGPADAETDALAAEGDALEADGTSVPTDADDGIIGGEDDGVEADADGDDENEADAVGYDEADDDDDDDDAAGETNAVDDDGAEADADDGDADEPDDDADKADDGDEPETDPGDDDEAGVDEGVVADAGDDDADDDGDDDGDVDSAEHDDAIAAETADVDGESDLAGSDDAIPADKPSASDTLTADIVAEEGGQDA